jgi:hypothetical protein
VRVGGVAHELPGEVQRAVGIGRGQFEQRVVEGLRALVAGWQARDGRENAVTVAREPVAPKLREATGAFGGIGNREPPCELRRECGRHAGG